MSLVETQGSRGRSDELPRTVRILVAMVEKLRHGSLRIVLPDSRELMLRGAEDGPHASLFVRDYRFARRLLFSGELGLAESYLRAEWDSPDLTALLSLFCVNCELVADMIGGSFMMRGWHSLRHWLNRNTRRQARRNISAHYDLGNDFYAEWLDKSMTYSSAYYGAGARNLGEAQEAKYTALAADLQLQPGLKLLEIGCGWGGFAEFAAKTYDVEVTGLTISREQYDHARRRIFETGLTEKVTIALRDYRDERGVYDRIASIEMVEAVGQQYWAQYFAQLHDCLAPEGRVGLQAITIESSLFHNYLREVDFIRAYIFPGGMLPTWPILTDLGKRHGLSVVGELHFAHDYAKTVVEWRSRFRSAWPALQKMGFDGRFRRLWELYFAYCEAGFRTQRIDVGQIIFAKS